MKQFNNLTPKNSYLEPEASSLALSRGKSTGQAMQLGLAFDDVLLLPGYSEVRRRDVDITSYLTEKIKLKIPFISSPMDTVTEAKLAIALSKLGGFGIIHRNLSIKQQVNEVSKVKKVNEAVGAAVGVGKDLEERVKALVLANTDAICVDSGHGLSKAVINATEYIHKNFPSMELISGNVATPQGVKFLAKAGAKAIRVGMGPGSICTTRVMSGMGVPQFSAILNCVREARKHNIKIIADGGIKFSGDAVKALAAGADTVMMGSIFASTLQAPGKVVKRNGKNYKYYRGMGSVAAMSQGSASRYGQENGINKNALVAEGVEGLVECKGDVKTLINQFVGGLRAGLYYLGAQNLAQLQKKAQFTQITPASLGESHPHSIIVMGSE
jgi:IMP dehydrogenase